MCSPDGGTFKIKTEPLDYVDCLFDAPATDEFDCSSFMTSASAFPNSEAPDYYTNIKVENLLEDENFPLLEQHEELQIKAEPHDELGDEQNNEEPFPGMVSIPNELLIPRKEIKQEVERPVDDRTLVCSVCNAEYTNVKEFVKHVRVHEVKVDKKPVTAKHQTQQVQPKVNKETVKVKAARKKLSQKPKERKCRICQIEFPTFNELVNHFLTHYNLSLTSPYQNVVQDGAGATTKSKRKTEQQPKMVEIPYNKKPKAEPPVTHVELQQHQHQQQHPPKQELEEAAAEHNPRRRRHICSVCDEEFPTISPLVTHFLTHKNLKLEKKVATAPAASFTCAQCPYQCSSMSRLKQHQETHTQGQPVICDTCQKSFRTQKLLDQHISRQHVRIECKECGQVFLKRNDMVEHYLKHFDLSLKRTKS